MLHLKEVIDSADDGVVAFDIMSGSQCVGFLEIDKEHADKLKDQFKSSSIVEQNMGTVTGTVTGMIIDRIG